MVKEKIKVKAPGDLSQLTLGQYQEWMAIIKTLKDTDDTEAITFSVFTGYPLDKVKEISNWQDVVDYSTMVHGWLNQSKYPLINRFSIDGIEFGLIPDLDNMSYGEYIDSDSYFGNPEDLHLLFAVLCRPVVDSDGNRYNVEKYNGTSKYGMVMKDMPLNVILGVLHFFEDLGMTLLEHIPSYLEDQIAGLNQNELQHLGGDGETIKDSIYSLKETFSDLMPWKQ